jgi:hypothetical protein
LVREVIALAEKGQQLFRGPEAQFPACIDLFDPTFEMALWRSGLWSKLQDECLSHHDVSLGRAHGAPCESLGEISVEFPLESVLAHGHLILVAPWSAELGRRK